MTRFLKIRAAAVVLGAAPFMPWYSSRAIVDRDIYFGNPLPLIDWVVLAAAAVVLIRPRHGPAAAVVGLISVALGGMLMWGDSAEGLRVAIEPGLPVAFGACIGLLVFRPKVHPRQSIWTAFAGSLCSENVPSWRRRAR